MEIDTSEGPRNTTVILFEFFETNTTSALSRRILVLPPSPPRVCFRCTSTTADGFIGVYSKLFRVSGPVWYVNWGMSDVRGTVKIVQKQYFYDNNFNTPLIGNNNKFLKLSRSRLQLVDLSALAFGAGPLLSVAMCKISLLYDIC